MALNPSDLVSVYRTHAQSILLYFQRRFDDPELAADLLAETFAVAIERGEQYRGDDLAQLSGWVWAIARSLQFEAERRGRIERERIGRFGIERRPLTEQEIRRFEELSERELLREQVAQYIDRLSTPQREAVQMKLLDGHTYAEVAARLGVNEAAARARVARGLETLRQRFLAEEGER